MTRRGPIALAATALLACVAAGVFAWWTLPDTRPEAVEGSVPPSARAAPAHHDHEPEAPVEAVPSDAPTGGVSPEEMQRLTDEALANGAELSEGLDLPPPARSDEPPPPRPENLEPTHEELVAHAEATLVTLERTIERLEADLAEVEAAGDDEEAHRLSLRLERTRDRLVEREHAVDQMRQETP